MAPPQINELFDKAILEVTVLRNAADGTGQVLDQILESGEEIRGFATGKGESAKSRAEDIEQQRARLEAELEANRKVLKPIEAKESRL